MTLRAILTKNPRYSFGHVTIAPGQEAMIAYFSPRLDLLRLPMGSGLHSVMPNEGHFVKPLKRSRGLIPTIIAKKPQRTETYFILPMASPRVGPGLRQVALALEVTEGRLISHPCIPIQKFDSGPNTERLFIGFRFQTGNFSNGRQRRQPYPFLVAAGLLASPSHLHEGEFL